MKNKKSLITLLILVLAISISALVACKTTTPLAAPVIKLDGNVVSWNAVENATSYDVKIGDDKPVNTTETSYTVNKVGGGTYDITVVAKSSDKKYSDSAASNKVTYVVSEPVEATYDELDLDTTNVKLTYYLDEGITELDLTGLVATAVYSDESKNKNVAVGDLIVGIFDLTTTGSKEVTISYTIEGVTQEATLFITVKERGIDDVPDAEKIFIQYDESGKYAVEYTSVRNMKGTELVADGMATLPEGSTLVNADGNFVIITVAYLIESVEDFNAINDDLDGYYVLMRDIDFGGAWHLGAYVGATPLKSRNEGTDSAGESVINNYLYTGRDTLPGTEAATGDREGVAFTGTLDGQGYALKNIKIHGGTESYWKVDTYGMAIFGYVGESGTIKNVTLRNVEVKGGKYTAFLVGYNQGTIENICVESNSVMYTHYRGGYAAAAYNDGAISNVVCYVSNYSCSNSAWASDMEIANNSTIGGDETFKNTLNGAVRNSYVANKTDLTDELGAGWKYFEGLGTVLANDDYVAITTPEREWAIGNRFYLDDVFVNGDNVAVAIYPSADYIDELGWDSERQSHYLVMKADSLSSVTPNSKITIVLYAFVKVGADPVWMQSTQIEVTIVAPVVVSSELVNEEGLEVIEGLDVTLTNISIKQTYSDGSEQIINPTRTDYDKNGAVGVAQQVKAYYGDGDDDYVTIEITPIAKSVTGIALDDTSAYKESYTAGEATELDLTGMKLVVSYNNGTSEKIDVTSAMLSAYDLSTAGLKEITVTYSGKTCALSITVAEAGVTVTGITVTGAPAKDTYKIGESVTLENLTGVTVTATLSNGGTTPVVIKSDMLSYDFTSAGNANITVTYEEKTATISVTVVDYATALTVTPTETTLTYNASTTLDLIANATYTLTMASGDSVSADASKVTASAYKAGHNTITYTYTDTYATVTATQDYDIWYELVSQEDVVAINDNLAGYYYLASDIDFYGTNISPIGQAPLKKATEGYEFDNDITNSITELPAKAFSGKFDGRGYVLKHASIHNTAWTQAAAYSMSFFGFIGEGGEVRNVTFRNISVRGGKFCSIVAAYNLGLIENVVIDKDCYLESYYTGAGAVSSRNYGTIDKVVSLLAKYDAIDGPAWGGLNKDLPAVNDGNTTRVTNCYIGDTSDLTAIEGSVFTFDEETKTGWKYFENLGTVYVNSDYVYIRATSNEIALGEKLYVYLAFVEDKDFIMQEWSDAEFVMKWDGEVGSHYIELTALGTDTIVGSTNIEINIRNGSWKGNHCIYLNIVEPKEGA